MIDIIMAVVLAGVAVIVWAGAVLVAIIVVGAIKEFADD
jgi:hypothetical protein